MQRNASASRHRDAVILMASCSIVLSLGLSGAWAQGPSRLDLIEPGFQAARFDECNGEIEKPIPGTGGLRLDRFQINAMECSPGGAWGDFIYMTLSRLENGDPVSRLARTDFQGNSETLAFATGSNVSMREFDISPDGWREGDSLFLATITGSFTSILERYLPDGSSELVWNNLSAAFIVSAVVDPTGLFDDDVFFWQGTDIMRRDAAGGVSLFAALPSAGPGSREMRFGPGGVWGDDLYTAGLTVAPDGTASPFPGGFSEFDWAFGPGFGGDMFNLAAVQGGPSEIYRVKPDGSRSLFATAPDVSQVLFCNGELWIGGEQGCFAVSEKRRGSNQ